VFDKRRDGYLDSVHFGVLGTGWRLPGRVPLLLALAAAGVAGCSPQRAPGSVEDTLTSGRISVVSAPEVLSVIARERAAFDSLYPGAAIGVAEGASHEAIRALLEYHGYPIFDGLMEGLWVSDYGLGHFTELGLAAYIFMNQQEANYLQLDIYLLPNQMLPEHYHLKTEKCGPKMEGWLCRYGQSYVYGEGPRTEELHAKIPAFEQPWVTVFHETVLDPGRCAHVNRPTAPHWQFAGPEGAILTEVGTFHDNDGVRHTDPNIAFG